MNKTAIHYPVTCLLLEDDPSSRILMEEILAVHFPQLRCSSCTNISEARAAYAAQQQMLLILDVNLPDGSSFEWLNELYQDEQHKFRVIFVTAYANYALEAFKFSALDFLLKPYTPAELVNAVNKAITAFDDQYYHKQLEIFFHNYSHQAKTDKKIILKTLGEIFVIDITDILEAEADNSYTKFRLKNGQCILVSQSLKEFDTQLSPLGFLRVHQSHLVHLKYIKAYKKKSNMLLLEEGLQVPVSQNKKIKVMDYLNTL